MWNNVKPNSYRDFANSNQEHDAGTFRLTLALQEVDSDLKQLVAIMTRIAVQMENQKK